MINRFIKPYFLFNPYQLIKAIFYKLRGFPNGSFQIKLPWKHLITSPSTNDFVGHRLLMHGIVSIEACEVAFRLSEVGNTVIDVGANIGVVTSALAQSVGQEGKVYSFEANPKTFKILEENIKSHPYNQSVQVFNCAISEFEGKTNLVFSDRSDKNSGEVFVTSKKVSSGDTGLVEGSQVNNVQAIVAKKLDNMIFDSDSIKLLKIDVERHEYSVLKGAMTYLQDKSIENIFFEDVEQGDTRSKELLWFYNYNIFSVKMGLIKLKLKYIKPYGYSLEGKSNNYSDFIATLNSEEVLNKFSYIGYKCFLFNK